MVELAIALLVIGLAIGGILLGQELILHARIKNAIAEFTGIRGAFEAYRDRYGALPGDDPQAGGRWPGPAATSGNGDGKVAGAYNNEPCAAGVESCSWWEHLRRAGFLPGGGTAQPRNAFNGIVGVQTGDGTAPAFSPVLGGAGGANGFIGLMVCSANVPDKIASAIDVQIDDGARLTGTLRGMQQSAGNPPIAVDATVPSAGGAASYVEGSNRVYTICDLLEAR